MTGCTDAADLRKPAPFSDTDSPTADTTDWFSLACMLIIGLVVGCVVGLSFQPTMVAM